MGVVIRRWVWLETICVVSGCFRHIATALVSVLFCSSIYIHVLFASKSK